MSLLSYKSSEMRLLMRVSITNFGWSDKNITLFNFDYSLFSYVKCLLPCSSLTPLVFAKPASATFTEAAFAMAM